MATLNFSDSVKAKLASMAANGSYDSSALGKLAGSLKRRGKQLDIDTHAALCAALSRAAVHGDANSAALVLNAMPNSARTKTAVQWMNAWGTVSIFFDSKTKAYKGKMVKAEDRLAPDMEKALATPFWTEAEKTSPTAFSDMVACKRLEALLKAAQADTADLSPEMKAVMQDIRVSMTEHLPEPSEAAAAQF